MSKKENVTRRNFIKQGSVGSLAVAVSQVGSVSGQATSRLPAGYDRSMIFAKLGDTLIPSAPDDPGYRTLEPYNITAEVMKGLEALSDQDDLALFNSHSATFFGGKSFVELSESQRADYLNMIVDGDRITDSQVLGRLQAIYNLIRTRVFVVFYQNYPQHMIPKDEAGVPVLSPNNKHQITNPNLPGLVTGWDIAGWKGPMTWEEEEQRRAYYKKGQWSGD